MNFWTYSGYNEIRQKTAETNANGVVTLYNYCTCGALSSTVKAWNTPAQQEISYFYDYAGNLTNTAYADGYSVTNWYDPLRQKIAAGDGAANRWLFYNNQGLLTVVSNSLAIESQTVYDIEDRPMWVTDGAGVTVTNTYDLLGRLETRTFPDTGFEQFVYSPRGLLAYTNQIGFPDVFETDPAGRRITETNANGEILRYTYNAAGDLLTLTDGKNQVTTWNCDEYGHVTNKVDQVGAVALRYIYDADNRLTNRWSAAKGTTRYTFDAAGNLTQIAYPHSGTVNLGYDPLNRLTNMVDAVGTTAYRYTSGGDQLLSEDGPFASDTLSNSFANRLRTGLVLQQPTGNWTNGFSYDVGRRLYGVTSPAGTFSYGYISGVQSLLSTLQIPNGAYITNNFDPVARLSATWLRNSINGTIDATLYGYDLAGQRSAYTNGSGVYVLYGHDRIGQLKSADSSAAGEDRGYAYDAAWNLHYRTNNGSVSTFVVNPKNELTNAFGAANSFDANGNLTFGTNSHNQYVYDDENRLIQWFCYTNGPSQPQPGDRRTDFSYDGLGRLRKRLEYSVATSPPPPRGQIGPLSQQVQWTLASETRYIYDGNRVIQERSGGNVPLVSYTRGRDLSGTLEGAGGIGGLLARSSGYSGGNWTSHAYYFADALGNILRLLDGTQGTVATYGYDPYGNLTAKSGVLADDNVYRFSSKELHVYSGMYYFLYRFYSPNLQRWINRDPILEIGGINLYRLAFNDPVGAYDPFGNNGFTDACKNAGKAVLTAIEHVTGPVAPFAKAGEAAGGIAELTPYLTNKQNALHSPINDPWVPTYGPPQATIKTTPPVTAGRPVVFVPIPTPGYPVIISANPRTGAIYINGQPGGTPIRAR